MCPATTTDARAGRPAAPAWVTHRFGPRAQPRNVYLTGRSVRVNVDSVGWFSEMEEDMASETKAWTRWQDWAAAAVGAYALLSPI